MLHGAYECFTQPGDFVTIIFASVYIFSFRLHTKNDDSNYFVYLLSRGWVSYEELWRQQLTSGLCTKLALIEFSESIDSAFSSYSQI